MSENRFTDYETPDLAAQCRMQATENLDPEYCQFMTAVAERLEASLTSYSKAIEDAAKVADQLGGDRPRPKLREGNDAEARTDLMIRAQHVRAKTIATAIRALSKDQPL